jgi:hypothetical protein
MLGEQFAASKGKRTSRRVLSVDGGFTVEVSFEAKGMLAGVEYMEVASYTSSTRPDGGLFGSGQGVIITKDGEVVTWKGSGIGEVDAQGGTEYRGAIYFSTTSGKLAWLNKIAGVFEFSGDAEGNTDSKVWEWK